MKTRQEFLTDLFRYFIAGILVLFAALVSGKKSTPSAQGQPCNLQSKCAGCSQNGNCPYQQAQNAGM